MLEALLMGDLTPSDMAALARGSLQQKLDQLEEALEGRVRDHHRFLVRRLLAQLDFLEQEVAAVDAEIDQRLADHAVPPADDHPSTAPTPPSNLGMRQRIPRPRPLRWDRPRQSPCWIPSPGSAAGLPKSLLRKWG
jgi:hypothetical protein